MENERPARAGGVDPLGKALEPDTARRQLIDRLYEVGQGAS